MKPLLGILLCLLATAHGQQATPPPKKPFTGFGPSALDKKPGGATTGSLLPQRTPTAAPPPQKTATAADSKGIVLDKDWEGHVTQGAGGQTRKIDDLKALLSTYGVPEADTGAHPEVTVYEGPTMDGGGSCRIGYLTPLAEVEKLLFRNRGIATTAKAVAPGFPDGLFLHTYDVKVGIYNRLCIVTDYSKPQQQVVSLVLKAQNLHWIPLSPPWVKIERDWHTFDYVNTQNRGQPRQIIDTRVLDLRSKGHLIVVKSSGANRPFPPIIQPVEIVEKPAGSAVNETTTWYVPEPLIKLILYCISKQGSG